MSRAARLAAFAAVLVAVFAVAAAAGAAFAATFPTEGRYRLFLQFKHEGRVHTAAFTQEVLRP